MSAPTPKVRQMMLDRDKARCVACGSFRDIEAQHRRAVGMGGSKQRPTVEDLLAACSPCNTGFEGNWRLQRRAVRNGWKVERWVKRPGDVPVFYTSERAWFRLHPDGQRTELDRAAAYRLMRVVYGPGWTPCEGVGS